MSVWESWHVQNLSSCVNVSGCSLIARFEIVHDFHVLESRCNPNIASNNITFPVKPLQFEFWQAKSV